MPSDVSIADKNQGRVPTVEELKRELAEAHRRETATAEVLKVISRSTFNLQAVLDTLIETAVRLCEAGRGVIFRRLGDSYHGVAFYNASLELIDFIKRHPITPGRDTITARVALEGRTVHVADLQADTDYRYALRDKDPIRTELGVPMFRGHDVVGIFILYKLEVQPFTDKQIELVTTFAGQAVIAIENTRLFEAEQASKRELTESLQQQTATADVLKVISRSTFDLQTVLDTLVESAARLCAADTVAIWRPNGNTFQFLAQHPFNPEYRALVERHAVPVGRGSVAGRTLIEGRPVQVADVLGDPEYAVTALAKTGGYRTILGVPLMREGAPIGVIMLQRSTVQPFTDKQIDLLMTFADQAVIAIENTRLFEEVQSRTKELQESLDRQTATSEVLGVISRSPNEVQPVLDTIVATAQRLCQAERGGIWRLEGETFRAVAHRGLRDEQVESLYSARMPVSRGNMIGRATLARRAVQVEDWTTDRELDVVARAYNQNIHTILAVPLLLKGEPIGVIALSRTRVAPFDDKQVALVEAFADQAVIAIENSRLFEAEQASKRELTEALEQQTATSDVLKVISRSALDLQRVLDALVESAARLCEANDALIFQVFGDGLRLVAHHGQIPTPRPVGQLTVPLARGRMGARAVIDRRTIHVADMLAETEEYPESRKDALQLGWRTTLAVPLVHASEAIGVILIRRGEVRPFTERQIELVNTFADQAVIAIENTRLFQAEQASKRELTEALEYQTATTDVLNVISRSKFDLQPVLDSIVETAARLCACDMATIRRREGDVYVQLAGYGLPDAYAEYSRNANWHHAGRGSLVGRVLQEGKAVQIPDVLADPDYTLSEAQQRGGFRSTLGVPLLRGADQIGIIVLMRRVVQPFSDKQIELVTAFADQAVIAIENTRLFEEVQSRTAELAKTVEDLEIASQHKSQFVANMSHELRTPLAAILGYAELIQEGFYGPQPEKSMDALTRIRSNGKHLLGLINTVLDIAKIESGQFTLNMSEYAIESVVETVRSATESLAQNKKLTLTTDVAKSLPVGLGDEQRLTQVLLNLVGNAIKFTDTGEVRVTAKAINGQFNVSVIDTGPGIPEEHQARIFEQFHQVDSSNTKAKGGTGLGLAIAKQIVEMHGGRIWVESTVGKGSTFQMEIPARAQVARSA